MSRPTDVPEQVWLGCSPALAVLAAFTDRGQAARWAAKEPSRRVFPVTVPADVPVSRGVTIPERADLEGVDPEPEPEADPEADRDPDWAGVAW